MFSIKLKIGEATNGMIYSKESLVNDELGSGGKYNSLNTMLLPDEQKTMKDYLTTNKDSIKDLGSYDRMYTEKFNKIMSDRFSGEWEKNNINVIDSIISEYKNNSKSLDPKIKQLMNNAYDSAVETNKQSANIMSTDQILKFVVSNMIRSAEQTAGNDIITSDTNMSTVVNILHQSDTTNNLSIKPQTN